MSVTVNKLDYIYKKLLQEAKQKMNDTVEISDEEYGIIYGDNNGGNNSGNQGGNNDDPVVDPVNNDDPVVNPSEEDDETEHDYINDIEYTDEYMTNIFELNYELYENENNDLILNIKNFNQNDKNNYDNSGLIKYYIKTTEGKDDELNAGISLYYGENNITSIIEYIKLYQYSYENQYSLTINIYKAGGSILKQILVLFNLQNDLSYYKYSVVQKPKFLYNFELNNFQLIQPAIIKYKNNNFEINNINDFDIYIYHSYKYNINALHEQKIIINSQKINSTTLNFNIYDYINLEEINDTYSINNSDIAIHYDLIAKCKFKTRYESNFMYKLKLYDNRLTNYDAPKYHMYYIPHSTLTFNDVSLYKNPNIINTYNKSISNNYLLRDNCKVINFFDEDFINAICQELNCQKSALIYYVNWQWHDSYYLANINYNNDINIIKNDNYINEKIILHNITITYNNNKYNHAFYEGSDSILNSLQPFKLFITIDNINYILVNIIWISN